MEWSYRVRSDARSYFETDKATQFNLKQRARACWRSDVHYQQHQDIIQRDYG